jgi:hypothetical protein
MIGLFVNQMVRGRLVTQNGSMSCQNIKNVATACSGVAPYLSASSLYYYFDGYTGDNWPTHDPGLVAVTLVDKSIFAKVEILDYDF